MRKKVLSILLALCMVLSLTPVASLALDDAPTGNTLNAPSFTLQVNSNTGDDSAARANLATYKTLRVAIRQAQAGDTIKLTSDITENVEINTGLTFDFNGYTLTCPYNSAYSSNIGISVYAAVTIHDSDPDKKGRLVAETGANGNCLREALKVGGGGNLIVEDCHIIAPQDPLTQDSANKQDFFALNVPSGKVTIRGTFQVEGAWSEETWANGSVLYGMRAGGRGAEIKVENGARVNALGGIINGDNRTSLAPVWFEGDSAANAICRGTVGQVGVKLDGDYKLQANTNIGFLVPENQANTVTLDLNGFNISTLGLSGYIYGGSKLAIVNSKPTTPSVIRCGGAPSIMRYDDTIETCGDLSISGNIKVENQAPESYFDGRYDNHAFCIYQDDDRTPISVALKDCSLYSNESIPLLMSNGNVSMENVAVSTPLDSSGPGRHTGVKLSSTKVNTMSKVDFKVKDVALSLGSSTPADTINIRNVTVNKGEATGAATGISNSSSAKMTITGKDSYYICDKIYTGTAKNLEITAGVYNQEPNQYVPDTDGDKIKDYAILDYSDTVLTKGFLVAPWTKVGADNKVSLYYPASATDADTASDDVSIVALNDTDSIIPDAKLVQPGHFTLSSKADTFTGIDGLSVTGFTNGNRLTVTKTKACNAEKAYVWYGGRNVGEIIIETKNQPTYDVGGEIIGAIGKPTAYLIRDGVKYDATVTGTDNPYQYVVTGVPAGIYNLVVSSANAESKITTTTVLVAIINQSIAQNVVLPQKTCNSIVTTEGNNTPNVEAGGLDEMAKTVGAPDANTYVLIELKVAENESSDHADAVRAAITNDGMVKGIIMDTDVLKTVNNAAPVEITEINQSEHGVSLITAVFHLPKNLQGQDGYAIFRYHGTQVDKITETANINGEYMTVNAKKDTITARLNRFSTYSIAYSEKHTVTFDANGGSVTPTSAKTNEANRLDSLPTPTRDGGYSFDGWYTAADGGTKVTTDTVFTKDSTIYAHWTYNGGSPTIYYTITATADTGGTISPVGNVTVGLGESKSFTITANPDYAISDVKVDGVSKGAISTYTFTNITANHTIMATYEKIKGDLKGELTVSKTVTGGGNKNALFTFRFTFSEAGKYGYTGSKTGSISNGGRIQLKHGESVTITIPRGVTYTVVEDAATRYIPTPKSRTYTGTITATPVTANFENRYDEKYIPPEPTLTGSLKVKKTVKGDLGDKDKKFAFIVTFNADGQYRYIGSKSGVIESGDTLWLRHGEYVKILNLPEGTDYSVKERENSGYKVDASGETGVIVANDVSTATFTNSRSGAPKTGDDNSLLGGMLTMVGGILGMATLLVLNGRKRRKNQGEGTVK